MNINREPYFIQPGVLRIIGVTGEAESGKGTFCSVASGFGYMEGAFAQALKRATKEIFLLTDDDVLTQEGKQRYLPYWDMPIRNVLQLLGTEAMQPVFGKTVWCKTTHSRIVSQYRNTGQRKFIIGDLRFEHELKYVVEEMHGVIVHIKRPLHQSHLDEEQRNHTSESSIAKLKEKYGHEPWYHTIVNSGTGLNEFKDLCYTVMKTITGTVQ